MKIKTLKSKFIASYIISLLIVLAVTLTAFGVGFGLSTNSYIKTSFFSMQRELDESVAEVVNETAYLYARIVSGNNLSLLQKTADATAADGEREQSFNALIERSGMPEKYFNDVVLISDDKTFSFKGNPHTDEFDYSGLVTNRLRFLGVSRGSIAMGIYSSGMVSGFTGTFVFYIDETSISEMCDSSGSDEDGYSFIMCSDGLIASHPESSMVGKSIVYSDIFNVENAPQYKTDKVGGKKSIIVISVAETLNFQYGFDSYIISVLDYNFYFGKMNIALSILISAACCMFVIAAGVAIYTARKVTKPITALSGKINSQYEKLNSDAESVKEHYSVLNVDDELVQLERNYDAMMDRIYELVEKNKEDAQLQRKLELDSLQMQINPHFLYNTLDAISWMAKIKKQPEIDRLVINLAKFFRLSLHNGDKFVTVEEEAELVKSFLEIDKIRFPDKVNAHFEVDESVAGCKILKLILQPLVENCLKYAFPEKGGNIWIRAYPDGGDVVFEVEDDGVGFEVPDDILTRQPKNGGGYGLKNVNERIRLQYGEEYGLTVKSALAQGAKFTIRLKKITD